MQTSSDQGLWYLFFSMFFVALIAGGMWFIMTVRGELPESISFWDAALVVLATFRLTRLFVYDKITQFFRDWFMKTSVVLGGDGVLYAVREKRARGPWRTVSDLLDCPWCTGMWFALFVPFFYFLTPLSWFPIFILAVGGVASLLQVLANLIGWSAEKRKLETQQL